MGAVVKPEPTDSLAGFYLEKWVPYFARKGVHTVHTY